MEDLQQPWRNYAFVANLSAQTEDEKCSLFTALQLRVYSGLSFETRSKQTEAGNNNLFSKVMEKLVKKATGEMNEIYERFLFNSRNLLLRVKLPVSSGSGVLCECGPRQGTTRQGYSTNIWV